MKVIVNAEKMKTIDRVTIEKFGMPSMVLMERAALVVASLVKEKVGKKERILAVCGRGNNGGDGVAVARMLKESGYEVHVLLLGDGEKSTSEMKMQIEIARKFGVQFFNTRKISEYNIIIDAIFGIGLKKPVEGSYQAIIEEINQGDNLVFAVDVPSGISADTGKVLNVAVKADFTVTFGFCKVGLLLYPGFEYGGEVIVADIGFPRRVLEEVHPDTFMYQEEDIKRLPFRPTYSNKGSFGRVLVIAGSKNMAGACFLAGKAAYTMGAGLVKILTVEDNRQILQTLLPEAVLSTYTTEGVVFEKERILKEILWAQVILVGPGMGISEEAQFVLDMVLENAKVPVVIDADGINMLSQQERTLPEKVILTPHIKEMSRLRHCKVEEITGDLMAVALDTAREKQCVCVLKDARTIIADGSQVFVNVSGNHGMATGGSGDVLSGVLAGLLGQGMNCFEAAGLGVYLHGLAGDYATMEKGAYGVMASDILESLTKVVKKQDK